MNKKIKRIKQMPSFIKLYLLILIISCVYYYFFEFFTIGLFNYYNNTFETINLLETIILIFLLSVVGFTLFIITDGFLEKTKWTRKFTIIFLIWNLLWVFWGLILTVDITSNIILLIIYVVLIGLLFYKPVLNYFQDKIFKYGDYTLYFKLVHLKSGTTIPTYFFSKKKPKSGKPASLPEGYTVKINKRSNMPYLKKIKNDKKNIKNEKVEKKSKIEKLKSIITKRKKPNVIYVVSKPQPGQVKGDWAVRSHKKIYSHHRTKKYAIKQARKVARDKNATVLIQRTDGTFEKGFKPRDKKT
ncbi:MAG: DUF2188 domain-containing protein [Candidatus Thermoplasmatota archaeon]